MSKFEIGTLTVASTTQDAFIEDMLPGARRGSTVTALCNASKKWKQVPGKTYSVCA